MSKSEHLEEAKSISLGYLVTGLTIIFLATILGFLNRLAQTGAIGYDRHAWYVLMTLHGMLAFVGWGVFVCMGLTFYVVVKVTDSPLHSPFLAKTAYWIFMVGGVLIVWSTLVGEFAGSWVFLYPLPFYSGGSWEDSATFLWLTGVLLAGVAILIVEFEVLLTVRKAGFSIVDALGFEAIKPKPKDGYKIPLPLVPLVVNALGMIIATIPFAVMLVMLQMESLGMANDVIDPLLAKNILWWFGHPVVYALLFPAAGFAYYMTERITGSKLIGERMTKLAWLIATLVQNFIGSHHVYQDFVQWVPISIMMQIFTYAITIPSLATLFAVLGTIYVKDFEWNLPAKYLFLAMLGWLLAGLSGVVNATILLNRYVHNSLWVVAHFHAMALLNITMMIFGVSYFLIQDFSGKEVADKKLAEIAMWLKYVGVIGFVHCWFIQGIFGGIRRSYTSTPGFGLLTWLSIPFGLMILVGLWLSMFVMWRTIAGTSEASPKESAVTA